MPVTMTTRSISPPAAAPMIMAEMDRKRGRFYIQYSGVSSLFRQAEASLVSCFEQI